MSKSLCKLSRHDIADNLGVLYQIVGEAQYVCRSCARASRDKQRLCKPVVLTSPSLPTKETEKVRSVPMASVGIKNSGAKLSDSVRKTDKKALKKMKKALRKQKKWQKRMKSVLKKQKKLINKQRRIDAEFSKLGRLALSEDLKAREASSEMSALH